MILDPSVKERLESLKTLEKVEESDLTLFLNQHWLDLLSTEPDALYLICIY